ncbi:MAG: TerC family protein [Acidobacteria bacterium]|nr:TerC family protein [Acidobacteriota bacterium]
MTHFQSWVALGTLTALEIVLGIDNIIFISVLVGRLPQERRNRARVLGLALAMVSRILLLLSLTWVMGLKTTLFEVFSREFSGRDVILIGGGLFLLAKSTREIHHSLMGDEEHPKGKTSRHMLAVLAQIAVLDIIFSLDSVITAIGLAEHVTIMMAAIVIAVGVMMLSARAIGEFVDGHPTVKMLALSFLLLVGFTLFGEGFGLVIPKGYIYFAMGFSVMVELLNIKMRKRMERPIKLHKAIEG